MIYCVKCSMTRKFCMRQTYQFTQLIKVVSPYNDILSRDRVKSPKIGPPVDSIIQPTNSAAHCGSHSGKAPLDVLTTSAFVQVFSCNEKQQLPIRQNVSTYSTNPKSFLQHCLGPEE